VLVQPIVPKETHHIPFLGREAVYMFMKSGPGFQRLGFDVAIRFGFDGLAAIRKVFATDPLSPEIMPGQIDQFPPDLHRRQPVELLWRLGFDIGKGSVQTEHGILEHVVGLGPPADARVSFEHFPRQFSQPVACVGDNLALGLGISGPQEIQPPLKLRRIPDRSGHLRGSLLAAPESRVASQCTTQRGS
jgi:hypothetical protein